MVEGVPIDMSYQRSTVSLSQILDTPLPTRAQDPPPTSQARIPPALLAPRATKAPAASSRGSQGGRKRQKGARGTVATPEILFRVFLFHFEKISSVSGRFGKYWPKFKIWP